MRALLPVALITLAACSDVRDYEGTWEGPRGGADATATLTIEQLDKHGLAGRLTIDGIADDVAITSVEGAEADVLAGVTFAGSPLRVYLAFAPATDGGGDALAVIALYDDDRIEVRLLRGGATPLYAIFALRPR